MKTPEQIYREIPCIQQLDNPLPLKLLVDIQSVVCDLVKRRGDTEIAALFNWYISDLALDPSARNP